MQQLSSSLKWQEFLFTVSIPANKKSDKRVVIVLVSSFPSWIQLFKIPFPFTIDLSLIRRSTSRFGMLAIFNKNHFYKTLQKIDIKHVIALYKSTVHTSPRPHYNASILCTTESENTSTTLVHYP